jgi:hypothetical protein
VAPQTCEASKRQFTDTLLTRNLHSHSQRFAVHGILYAILPHKIRKNTEKVDFFCAKVPRFPGAIVIVAA